ncbi:MAG: hypothetical protein ABI972_13710 [Acidobacteriota bacterium]
MGTLNGVGFVGLFVCAATSMACGSRWDFEHVENSPDHKVGISIIEKSHFPTLFLRHAGVKILARNGSNSRILYERPNDVNIEFFDIVWSANYLSASVLMCDAFGPDIILDYDFSRSTVSFDSRSSREILSNDLRRRYRRRVPGEGDLLDWACSTQGPGSFDAKFDRSPR